MRYYLSPEANQTNPATRHIRHHHRDGNTVTAAEWETNRVTGHKGFNALDALMSLVPHFSFSSQSRMVFEKLGSQRSITFSTEKDAKRVSHALSDLGFKQTEPTPPPNYISTPWKKSVMPRPRRR